MILAALALLALQVYSTTNPLNAALANLDLSEEAAASNSFDESLWASDDELLFGDEQKKVSKAVGTSSNTNKTSAKSMMPPWITIERQIRWVTSIINRRAEYGATSDTNFLRTQL